MSDPPPPPVVTITDPSRPGEPTDVLGSSDDRAPWRPSVSAWATAVLVLLTVPAVLALKERGDRRTASLRALESVSIVAGDEDFNGAPFQFRNAGADPVTVIAGRFDRDGAQSVDFDATVKPGDTTTLLLPTPTDCPPVVPQNGPSGVLLTVRTEAGTRQVRVDIRDSVTSLAALQDVKERCSLYEPYESLRTTSLSLSRDGAAVTVEVEVRNEARLPRTVLDLRAPEGFAVEARDLPLTVAPSGHRDDPADLAPHQLRRGARGSAGRRGLRRGHRDGAAARQHPHRLRALGLPRYR